MIPKWVVDFNKNATIKKKITFFFIPLLVLIILLFGELSNSIYRHYIGELTKEELLQRTERIKEDIEFRLSFFRNVSDYLFVNKELRDFLSKYYESNNQNYVEIYDGYEKLVNALFRLCEVNNNAIGRLYTINSSLPSDGRYVFDIDKYPVKDFVEKIEKDNGRIFWIYYDKEGIYVNRPVFIMSRVIKDYNGNPLAILNIEVDSSFICNVINTIDIGSEGWYIYSFDNGSEIFSKGKYNLQKSKNKLVVRKEIPFNGTILEVGYSDDIIRRMGRDQQKTIMIIAFVFIFAAIGASAAFSKLALARMMLFINKIKSIDNGESLKVIDGEDEIAVIDRNFNTMLNRLNENIQKTYRLEIEKKMTESELLQAQINPHFLYNTLSAIRWSVIKQGDVQVSDILDKLVAFYRLVLSGGQHIITISKELDIVQSYTTIQQYTYDQRYHVEVDVQPEIRDLYTLKFILQPIVENSIFHGINENGTNSKIGITVRRCEGVVKFIIIDNGSGMSEEKVNQLNSVVKDESKSSYGIYNINRRIKLYYGDEYGVVFESFPGIGTKAEITIPVCVDKDCNVK